MGSKERISAFQIWYNNPIIVKYFHFLRSKPNYHMQTNNKNNFLSLDFGLEGTGIKSGSERLKEYREYLYEAGAIDKSEKGSKKVINEKLLTKERKKGFQISRTDRFLNRTRYFSDSGVIDSKEFVSKNYQRFKHLFQSKEKKPKTISGLDGVYSLKRLIET